MENAQSYVELQILAQERKFAQIMYSEKLVITSIFRA
jgi:hypothetical protein